MAKTIDLESESGFVMLCQACFGHTATIRTTDGLYWCWDCFQGGTWSSPVAKTQPKSNACSCGAEAVYGPDTTHDHWCPKYEED